MSYQADGRSRPSARLPASTRYACKADLERFKELVAGEAPNGAWRGKVQQARPRK